MTTHNLAFTKDALGLVVRRLPQPLPGTGAIAEYAELGNFGMRVTMSYQPNTLAQQFTVDVLYGVGVLRNASGCRLARRSACDAWRLQAWAADAEALRRSRAERKKRRSLRALTR